MIYSCQKWRPPASHRRDRRPAACPFCGRARGEVVSFHRRLRSGRAHRAAPTPHLRRSGRSGRPIGSVRQLAGPCAATVGLRYPDRFGFPRLLACGVSWMR
ncbi:hypothetical protein SKAU_G00335360 [Synaphobranchus kaupii]|uniref:Uncharacterized protein n=1 Tax=Synaphobranchus kaupii TaxID=118154 RepID=A0A9Q1EM40_SYNKA|nr:hypothetical protein SKAU_G00335360 [Synaphobranchus kaupii]